MRLADGVAQGKASTPVNHQFENGINIPSPYFETTARETDEAR